VGPSGVGTTAFSHNGGVFVGNTLTFTATCLDPGRTITLTITGTVAATAPAGYTIPNSATVTYTSLPGSNGASPNPTGSVTPGASGSGTGERNGQDGVGGLNDYAATASASAPLSAPQIDKRTPTPASAPIGGTVTFPILVTLPEGVTQSLVVTDNLPVGLVYVSHSVVTTAAASGGLLAADYNGTLPAPTVTAPGGSGDDLTLDFGNVTTAADNVTNNNAFVIFVTARVNNELGNQNGTVLGNTASLTYTDPDTGTTTISDGPENVTVVEPELDIQKSADDTTPAYGQTLTYTLTVSHLTTSAATAYDIVITDTIPAGLTYVAGSISAPAGWTVNDAGAPTLTWSCSNPCSLPVGNTASLSYQVTVNGPPGPPNPGDVLTNTASMTWTSLDGTDPNERTGAGGINDYADSDGESVTFTAIDLTISKDDGSITSSAGGVVQYTLSYRNDGNSPASGVIITEIVPANTTFNAGASTSGWSCADGSPAGTTCTFTVGTLNPGSSGSVIFAVTVDNPLPAGVTQIANTASIGDDGTHGLDADSSNNSHSDTTPVEAAPDLRISKTDGGVSTMPGAVLTYTLTYTNVGNQGATGVILTETVPAHTTFTGSGWTCIPDNNAGSVCTFSVGALNAGASGSATFVVTVNATVPAGVTQIANTAIIGDDGTNGPDPTPGDNSGSDTTPLEAAPDLQISKTDGGVSTMPGAVLTYTLTYTNVGNQGATGVILTETVPAHTTFTGSGWTCIPDNNAGSVCTFSVGALNAGASGSATFVVTVNATVPAGVTQIANTAVIGDDGTNGPDPTPGDNSGSDTTPLEAAPDLRISKTDGGVSTMPGAVLTYTLTYTNVGNQGATGVILTETVPAHTTFTGSGWTCIPDNNAGSVCTFSVGALNAGASGSATFVVTVNATVPAGVTQIANTAIIGDDGTNGPDPTPGDNSGSDTTPLEAAPDLVITKDDGFTVVSPGQVITYTLTIRNVGTQDATGVVVTDTLPANTTFVSASDSGTYNSITRVVTWPAFDLAAGASVTRTVEIQVNDPFPSTSILNQAHVEDDGSNGSDLTPANNDATDTDSVVTLPNSDLTKSLIATNRGFTPDPSVAIGEMLTYEVTFTVPAGGTMTNLKLTDTLDRGLAFVGCVSVTPSDPAITTTLSGGFAAACNDPTNPTVATEPPGSTDFADEGRKITFTLGDVSNSGASNGTVSVRYTVVVLDSIENQDGVRLNNSATLTWDSGSLSTAAPEVTIVEPDFELTKEADRTVALPGSVITFTLTFGHTNISNVDAFDVVLTDVLPPGLTYVPGSLTIVSGPPGGVWDETGAPTLRVTWAEFPLLTGSSRTQAVVRFQAVLGNLAPGQRVRNTASLEWTSLLGDVTSPQSPYNALSTERYYDPGSDVNVYGVLASLDITVPRLPSTGFAPGVVTPLPAQPAEKAYQALGDLWLEIPKLGVKMPIVGIPAKGEEWDLTWLWDQAGWLEGTAYPTHAGNSAITAHVYLPNGQPGLFYKLDALRFGDAVIVHLSGQRYVFEVRQVQRVSPNTLSALRHEELPWLTLITCREYDPKTNSYRSRLIVRAVLVKILE
jgi:LPXTG-site transpeptidase (sortase) family protein